MEACDAHCNIMSGRKFKAIREAAGLTKNAMARLLEVSRYSIYRAEKDGPSRLVLAKLQLKFPNEALPKP
jgi:DNA-binding XRE family transcriptional regulator